MKPPPVISRGFKRPIGRIETIIKPAITHSWDIREADALKLQRNLAAKVIRQDRISDVKYVAGVDAAYSEPGGGQFAAVVVLEADTLEIVEVRTAKEAVLFPYIPGLFSFRELPTIIKALEKLSSMPELIVCDGQGIAHPKRLGIASHLGVLFDIPTIGCGKTRLVGNAETPDIYRGSYTELMDNQEIVGNVLRTQDNIKPVYVSIGHRISLPTARKWILRLSPRYRLPETTRQANQIVQQLKRSAG